MLVFPNNTSTRLLNLWLEDKGPAQAPLTPFHESALKELSNIATGAYLTALSKLTGNTFRCTPPLIANDILGSLLEEILSETALEEDNIFLIDTEFLLEQQTLDGFILFIVAPHSMKQIFTKIDLG
jgi:chemotaxis protein CheC